MHEVTKQDEISTASVVRELDKIFNNINKRFFESKISKVEFTTAPDRKHLVHHMEKP